MEMSEKFKLYLLKIVPNGLLRFYMIRENKFQKTPVLDTKIHTSWKKSLGKGTAE